jgi:hypothetical protein
MHFAGLGEEEVEIGLKETALGFREWVGGVLKVLEGGLESSDKASRRLHFDSCRLGEAADDIHRLKDDSEIGSSEV